MRKINSTRADGTMKNNDGTVAVATIEKFLLAHKFSPAAVCMEQVHGGSVSNITDNKQKIVKGVDAVITNNKEISLCVVTADCLPILLFDPQKQVIGAVHAGSKGLLKNIIHNTLEEFRSHFGSKPEDMHVTIGPAIEKACYEVGKELIEQFEKQFSWFDKNIQASPHGEKYFLDLRKTALQCLLKEGILRENIEISEQCTKCSSETLFSYRGGDTMGRFVSVITL